MTQETDHEVRIRLLEQAIPRLEHRMDRLEEKIDTQFRWLVGIILLTWITTITAVIGAALAIK